MGRHLREALPAEIQDTRARSDAWRRAHRSGTAHSAELWGEAVEWARRFGIKPVCRGLGLSDMDLKKRMGRRHEVREAPRAAGPTFVELSMDPGRRMQVPGERDGVQVGSQGGPEVEAVSPDGARMVMRWASGAAVDAGNLVASFLGRGR